MIKIKNLLTYFLLAELVSFLGYYSPLANQIGFAILVIVSIYFGLKNYPYLVGILFAELMIGSKGYLFVLSAGSFNISIRMVLWLLVLLFWLWHVGRVARSHGLMVAFRQYIMPKEFKIFWPLLAVVVFASINAFLNGNVWSNIYADANAWAYFLLLWPIYYVVKKLTAAQKSFYVAILTSAVAWLTIKTWLILFFFSHDFIILDDMYHWVRDTGVGEITAIKGSFYRIFIQSHVYPLIALVISWFYLLQKSQKTTLRQLVNDKSYLFLVFISSGLLSVVLIGLSRSFWVGLFFALVALKTMLFLRNDKSFREKIWHWWRFCSALLTSLALAVFIIFIIVRFPYPGNTVDFNATQVLRERATETNEAAIGSRWALLPVLGRAIEQSWLFGQGFGTTVTYESKDPRVVSATGGTYTTFAFEWGWLDLWLKLGLIGLLAYGYLLINLWRGKSSYSDILKLSLITLIALHIFTPYLNHPLGIGLILLIFALNLVDISTLPEEQK